MIVGKAEDHHSAPAERPTGVHLIRGCTWCRWEADTPERLARNGKLDSNLRISCKPVLAPCDHSRRSRVARVTVCQLNRRPGRGVLFQPERGTVSADLLCFGMLLEMYAFLCGPRHLQWYKQVNPVASSSLFFCRGSIGRWLWPRHDVPLLVTPLQMFLSYAAGVGTGQ